MDQKAANIIIVSRPGPMQDTLKIVLSSILWLEVIGSTGDSQEALEHIRDQRPTLFVIDSNLPHDQIEDLITQAKSLDADIRCLVFCQTSLQNTQALQAGADLVLPRDEASTDLEKSLWDLAFSTADPQQAKNAQPVINSGRTEPK